jgi:hypothetical protein
VRGAALLAGLELARASAGAGRHPGKRT